jgi:hypothetical protein
MVPIICRRSMLGCKFWAFYELLQEKKKKKKKKKFTSVPAA